jgi:hypothetical protein
MPKLANLTKNTITLRDIIDSAKIELDLASKALDLVSYISPIGDFYIGSRKEILEMKMTGSWR